MEIEKTDSVDAFEIRKILDVPPTTDITFHQRMKEFTSAVITDIQNQIASEATVSSNVSETFCQIINEFNATCSSFLDTVEIPESNEKELDQQQQANVDCEYLSKKLQHLQQIREGYTEEKEAWEKNIEFFKSPLSLTTVTMRDCAFEHLNDTETLSSAYEHCGELLSLLRSVKETRDEVHEARRELVDAYQGHVLDQWHAMDTIPSNIEDNLQPPRLSLS